MKKKCKVVMLPTNEKATRKSDLAINEYNLLFQPSKLEGTWFFLNKFQHLYILSNEKIKVGDWVYNEISKEIYQFKENYVNYEKKIIATTDNSLDLPKPSQSFIQKFVKEYRKGNIITDVLVEYEEISGKLLSYGRGFTPSEIKPKINPKDNTITITKIKDSWNREEVIKLCTNAFEAGDKFRLYLDKNATNIANENIPSSDVVLDTMNIDSWIGENLN